MKIVTTPGKDVKIHYRLEGKKYPTADDSETLVIPSGFSFELPEGAHLINQMELESKIPPVLKTPQPGIHIANMTVDGPPVTPTAGRIVEPEPVPSLDEIPDILPDSTLPETPSPTPTESEDPAPTEPQPTATSKKKK